MTDKQLDDYKKKLKLYEKLLVLWQQIYGDVSTQDAEGGPGSNPPPPPPKPPGS